jgi:caffeoyl-CoA O-methyltransferase
VSGPVAARGPARERRPDLYVFDADGTMRYTTVSGQPCPNRPDEWRLLPNVRETLGSMDWGPAGPAFGVASNQNAVACGHLSEELARRMLLDTVEAAVGRPPARLLRDRGPGRGRHRGRRALRRAGRPLPGRAGRRPRRGTGEWVYASSLVARAEGGRMKVKYTRLDDRLMRYVVSHRTPDDPVVDELRAETARLGSPAAMQISPEQATFFTVLVAAIGARRAVEVGTFTGLSALAIARGLPRGGRLLCCDVSEEWTAVARRYWRKAGVDRRIELRIAPALETLRALPRRAEIDFAFIDADKPSYPAYWDELVPRLRRNGLIAVDNVLWGGDVARSAARDEVTKAIRAFNDKVAADRRVESVMLPLADGVTLARKR